jgi:hypothetical protein
VCSVGETCLALRDRPLYIVSTQLHCLLSVHRHAGGNLDNNPVLLAVQHCYLKFE